MKKQIILILIFFLSASLLIYGSDNPAKIFFVNLYNENVDVRLGEENDPVFVMNSLAPYNSTVMVSTDNFGEHKLYFKTSANEEYYFWSTDGTNPQLCSIQEGSGNCIIVTTEGVIKFFYIDISTGEGPKISFLNGYNSEVVRMEVSKDWNKNVVAYTENLEKNSVTNFVTFDKGMFSLYWHMPEQVNNKEYFFVPDKSGKKPEIYEFKDNTYYIFLVFSADNKHYSNIININPNIKH